MSVCKSKGTLKARVGGLAYTATYIHIYPVHEREDRQEAKDKEKDDKEGNTKGTEKVKKKKKNPLNLLLYLSMTSLLYRSQPSMR